ncbi:MAG: DUF1449 family protein [Myxococcota bacterium]|nr:DUF1449 family protein [Myxococcota bacterium]
MSSLDWLAAWPNVPFTIVGAATLAFALLQASGALGLLGGGDADADVDADVDADADADVDADGDADANGGAAHPSVSAALLAPLAIGRVPLTLTAEIAGLSFAVTGLALNAPFFSDPSGAPLISLAWTLPASALIGYAAAALAARVLAPIVDDRPHAATSRRELVGTIGVVISSRVSDAFGEIRVRDRSGHDVRVVCRLAPECREIAEHEEAVVVDLDERGTLFVAPFAATAEPPPPHRTRAR